MFESRLMTIIEHSYDFDDQSQMATDINIAYTKEEDESGGI